jgi:hypothetical protein
MNNRTSKQKQAIETSSQTLAGVTFTFLAFGGIMPVPISFVKDQFR